MKNKSQSEQSQSLSSTHESFLATLERPTTAAELRAAIHAGWISPAGAVSLAELDRSIDMYNKMYFNLHSYVNDGADAAPSDHN